VALSDATEEQDASRRTYLAAERTYLAWWRTGLTALAVGIGAARIVPELSGADRWPFAIVGAGFALLGVLCVAYADVRRREIEDALQRGTFAPPHTWVTTVLGAAGIVLGIGIVVLSVI
jgi:putative membrane protein